MPHAENGTMSSTTVNGEKQSSAFISHLTSYPVINDSINTFKSNPIGQKSLDIADQSYATFAKPFMPYLARPYQYFSPYVHKADSIADKGLSKVDEQFPVVKTPTDKITGTVYNTVLFPFRFAAESKDYVVKTYGDEYQKIEGNGLAKPVKAVVSTGLTVTADSLTWLSHFVGAKKEQSKNVLGDKAEHSKHVLNDTTNQARSVLDEKTNQASNIYNEKTTQAQNAFNEYTTN